MKGPSQLTVKLVYYDTSIRPVCESESTTSGPKYVYFWMYPGTAAEQVQKVVGR